VAVHTKQLGTATSLGPTATLTLYTAPAGETVILKDWRLYTAGASVSRAVLFVQSGAADVALFDGAINADSVKGDVVWVVLKPGDKILLFSSVTGGVRAWVSGTELDGIAD